MRDASAPSSRMRQILGSPASSSGSAVGSASAWTARNRAGSTTRRRFRRADPSFTPRRLADDHPAFQPYTSGSTGRPKGVVLTHAGQCWWIRCLSRYWPTSPDYRALAAVPLYHKNAMAGAIKPMLSWGGSVVLLPNFEPRRFLQVLSEYRCTHAGGVPAVFTLLLAGARPDREPRFFRPQGRSRSAPRRRRRSCSTRSRRHSACRSARATV